MQHAGAYMKLLHLGITQIKALTSWCQLLYYPVGLVVMNVCTVRTQSQLLPGF